MRIEYTITGHIALKGDGWVVYYRDSRYFTSIFDALMNTLENSKDKTFEELEDILKDAHNNKTVRSKAVLYFDEATIEICKPNKTLPLLWIVKN